MNLSLQTLKILVLIAGIVAGHGLRDGLRAQSGLESATATQGCAACAAPAAEMQGQRLL
jgi:hypothetical protein